MRKFRKISILKITRHKNDRKNITVIFVYCSLKIVTAAHERKIKINFNFTHYACFLRYAVNKYKVRFNSRMKFSETKHPASVTRSPNRVIRSRQFDVFFYF